MARPNARKPGCAMRDDKRIELFAPTDYVCILCGAVGAREALCWPTKHRKTSSGGAQMQPRTLKTSTATQSTGRNDAPS